ncbi:regulating synaptic membrane exocytosis protein 1-like isoform X1 [Notothenia coriiceps]|uniref:Regulating synaptic membrane exocytosis protein 1-like isoform X1 n=1 Tax=Notothenia coriiceps TaxID=8208 RepID=A0A6I9MXJ4_9TELE|nr:PREDICTED: regulating synaptic membrane exocytosis protein 1-like isoform X1 [Notothenia coriiceps]
MTGYDKWRYSIRAVTCYCLMAFHLLSAPSPPCISFPPLHPHILALSPHFLLSTSRSSSFFSHYSLSLLPTLLLPSSVLVHLVSISILSLLSAAMLWRRSDLQPQLDRVRSSSTTCLRPDNNFHSPDRDRCSYLGMLPFLTSRPSRCSNSLPRKIPPSPRILVEHVNPEEDRQCNNSSGQNCQRGSKKSLEGDSRIQPTSILRGSRGRGGPLRPFGQTVLSGSCPNSPRLDRPHPHGSPSSPTGTPSSGRRGRQLPQLPAKSSSVEQALAVEERARQLQMKVHSYRPSASHDPETDLKTKREMYAEQRRGSDNMSARSSDSDMSDASALSRASSASRLSSTSYMSIQSERPGGRLRSVLISHMFSLDVKGAFITVLFK